MKILIPLLTTLWLGLVAVPANGADAFGLRLSEPVASGLLVSEIVPGTWLLQAVPAPFDELERYTARLGANGRLCAVTGNVRWSPAQSVESSLTRIRNRFSEIYGAPIVGRPEQPSPDKITFNQVWIWQANGTTIVARRILPPSGHERALSLEIGASGCT